MLRSIAWAFAALLAGCAGQETVHVPLESRSNTIQVTEVRVSMLSTLTVGVVYDEHGKIAGVTGAGGAPGIQIPLVLIEAAGTVAGGYLIGRGLEHLRHIDVDGAATVTVTPEIPPGLLPPGLVR